MFSRIRGLNKIFVTAFIPGFSEGKDHDAVNTKTARLMAEEHKDKKETGMDRIYMMFSTDEFGEPSPEIINIYQIMALSLIVGGGIGGFIRSRVAFLDFVERNDATSFSSHLDAKQKLQDKVTMGFGKGAWQWAWRLSAFTGTYSVISTTIAVYRGENGILEHVAAGGVTGALYKMNLGLRGIVVGGCLGSVLGVLSGVSIWGLLKLTGMSVDDVRQTGYSMQKSRDAKFQAAVDEYLSKKEPAIAHKHDSTVGAQTLNLDNIITEKPYGKIEKKI